MFETSQIGKMKLCFSLFAVRPVFFPYSVSCTQKGAT